jgi:type II secretory pathway component PulM
MSERERRLVVVGAVIVVLVLVLGVILPLDHSVARARTRLGQKQADLVFIRGVAPELQNVQLPANNGNVSMLVIIDRSAHESGLGSALAGTSPSGPGGLQVRLEKASFDALVGWLARLSQQNGIRVDGASIDEAGTPGLVNASLVLHSR